MSSGLSASGFECGQGLQGMAGDLVASPFLRAGAAFVRAGGLGQRPGGARPHSGARGVLDADAREPIIDAPAGEGPRRVSGLCGCVRPHGRPAGQPAGCIHPFVCPRRDVLPGGMGRVGVRGRAGPIRRRPCRRAGRAGPLVPAGDRMFGGLAPGGGEIAGGLAPGRQVVMRPTAAWRGGGCGRRACRRRPG